MLKFKSINYSHGDLIELLKNNTAAILNVDPKDLYVLFKINKNQVTAEIVRRDKKELIVNDNR